MISDQQDHRFWNREHVHWLEDIEKWETENSLALKKLYQVEERLKQHDAFFQELKSEMTAHEQEMAHHQHDMEHDDVSDQDRQKHEQGRIAHEKMRKRHNDYKRRHDWVMKTIEGLQSLLEEDSSVLS